MVVVEAIAEFLEKHQDAAWNETIINWEGAGEGIEIDRTDLVTSNTKHFRRIKPLSLTDWKIPITF